MSDRVRSILLALPGFERACRRLTRRHVRVLMYHRLTEDPRQDPQHLPVEVFRRQVAHIAATCRVIDPDRQALHEEGGPAADDRPPVVLTVDDGYADFRDLMVPALREHGLPVTLFVTTGFVDGTCWMWWDRVAYVLEETSHRTVDLPFRAERLRGTLDTDAGRRAFWSALVPALRFVAEQEKEDTVARLAALLEVAVPERPPRRYAALSWQDLAGLAAEGVNVGGHTRTHPILSRVDDGRARREVGGSRDDIADRLGRAPAWFAYPQGGPADYTPATVAAVREAGFRGSYVAYCDPRTTGDPYAKPRYNVDGDFARLRWTLCGAEYLVLRLKGLLGRSTGVSDRYWKGADMAAGGGPRTPGSG